MVKQYVFMTCKTIHNVDLVVLVLAKFISQFLDQYSIRYGFYKFIQFSEILVLIYKTAIDGKLAHRRICCRRWVALSPALAPSRS